VFQMFALYLHVNVRRNISYPLVSEGIARRCGRGSRRWRASSLPVRDGETVGMAFDAAALALFDTGKAMTMATHVGVPEKGMLVQFGTPRQVYEDPEIVYVATRLGQPRINIAPLAAFSGVPAPAGAVQIGLRPEHIAVGGDVPHAASARVRRVEHLGDQTRLHLAMEGAELVTLAEPHTPFQPGDDLAVGPVDPLFFDAAGRRLRA
jgi:ABC-type sugar transport system ATPase subunit